MVPAAPERIAAMQLNFVAQPGCNLQEEAAVGSSRSPQHRAWNDPRLKFAWLEEWQLKVAQPRTPAPRIEGPTPEGQVKFSTLYKSHSTDPKVQSLKPLKLQTQDCELAKFGLSIHPQTGASGQHLLPNLQRGSQKELTSE